MAAIYLRPSVLRALLFFRCILSNNTTLLISEFIMKFSFQLTQSLFSRLKRTRDSSLETEVRWCWALSGMATRLQTESTFFSESSIDTNSEQQRIPLQSVHSTTATEANIPPSANRLHPQTPAAEDGFHPQADVNGIKTVIIGEEETMTITISEGSRECSQTPTGDRHNVKASRSSRKEGGTFGHERTDVPSCSSRTPNVVSRSPMQNESESRMNKTIDGTRRGDGDDSDSVVLISDDEDVPPKRSKTGKEREGKEKSAHTVSTNSVESVDDILAIFESWTKNVSISISYPPCGEMRRHRTSVLEQRLARNSENQWREVSASLWFRHSVLHGF